MTDFDDNDLGPHGMDAVTQKRLRVGKLKVKRGPPKPKRPMRTHMPFHLKEGLRVRGWEVKTKSVKSEAYVFNLFYRAHPAIERYQIGKVEQRKNGFTVSGRIKGRRVIDYELDVSKEGTDVLVKFNLFPMEGNPLGETYRLSIVRAEKLAPKFARKFQEFLSELRQK